MSRSLLSRRNLIAFGIVALAIVVVVLVVSGANQQSGNSDLKRITVGRKNLEKLVIATGKLQGADIERQKPNYTGKLKDLVVEVDDYVEVDQLLAIIETKNKFGKKQDKELRAVIAGAVTAVTAKEGQPLIQDETPVLEITSLNKLKIVAEVVEADINKVAVGQTVKINISALGDAIAGGTVTQLAISPVSSLTGSQASTPSYNVEIDLNSVPTGARLGMTANVEIVTDTRTDVIAINDSYFYKKDGKTFVKVISSEKKMATESNKDADNAMIKLLDTEVSLGFRAETEVEILSGLNVGQELALPTAEIRNSRDSFSLFGSR